MNIKKLLMGLLLAGAGVISSAAQEVTTYIQRPIVPDSITSFTNRCNYLADHFFDFCDLKKVFSSRAKMGEEIKTYTDLLRWADTERGVAAVERLMDKLRNQPADQIFVASIAEDAFYGDTAEVWYDHLYLPFAQAVASNKKIKSAEKARFVRQAHILQNSLLGERVTPLEYVSRNGEKRTLDDDSAPAVLVMIADPACSDCRMAKLRLDADVSMRELVEEGRVKIVVIGIASPDDPEWVKQAAEMPEKWMVGANPDIDTQWDMRVSGPALFIYDRNHTLRWKNLSVNQVLDIARQLKKR
ncbi:MAG: DUF5106 domain-containing protein [Duncaniella sp.]|nr:DUF5106 domain-containing protein [Duncaniella sp.]